MHPRTGEPPNRGWFAGKPDAPGAAGSARPTDWPSKVINFVIRSGALKSMLRIAETDPKVRTAAIILDLTLEAIVWLRDEFPNEDSDAGQARAADQIYANFQPPRHCLSFKRSRKTICSVTNSITSSKKIRTTSPRTGRR